jgi:hypothetical protein
MFSSDAKMSCTTPVSAIKRDADAGEFFYFFKMDAFL